MLTLHLSYISLLFLLALPSSPIFSMIIFFKEKENETNNLSVRQLKIM